MPDCTKCDRADLRAAWGCDAPSTGGFRYALGEFVTDRCPNALAKTPFASSSWQLYAAYKRGHLPGGAGLSKETACFRATVAEIEALSIEFDRMQGARRQGGKT